MRELVEFYLGGFGGSDHARLEGELEVAVGGERLGSGELKRRLDVGGRIDLGRHGLALFLDTALLEDAGRLGRALVEHRLDLLGAERHDLPGLAVAALGDDTVVAFTDQLVSDCLVFLGRAASAAKALNKGVFADRVLNRSVERVGLPLLAPSVTLGAAGHAGHVDASAEQARSRAHFGDALCRERLAGHAAVELHGRAVGVYDLGLAEPGAELGRGDVGV